MMTLQMRTTISAHRLTHLLFATFILLPLSCKSQELSCKQIFMNKSEKAICGSTDLIQLDMKVGTLSRRAKFVDPNYSKDHRLFRSSLKKCNGDLSCITNLYSTRIDYLQGIIDGSRTLTDAEIEKIEQQDQKAAERFASQESARERYASDSNKQLTQDKNTPQETSTTLNETPQIYQDNAQQSTDDVLGSPTEAPITPQDQGPTNPAPSSTIGNQSGSLKTILGIWNLLPWWTWAGGAIVFLAYFSRKKCPRCGKRGTSTEVSRDHEGTSTEYRDVVVEDKHRDRHGQLIKTVARTEQRAVKVDHYTVHYRCKNCRHKWSESVST